MSSSSCLLGFLCLAVLGATDASRLVLTPSVRRIGPDGTPNFTMSCTCHGCNGASGSSPVVSPDGVSYINKFRILKVQNEIWSPVVEYDADWEVPLLSERVRNAHYTFLVGNDTVLQVKWDLASNSTGGDYMCEVMADSGIGQGMYLRSQTVRVDVQLPLTLYDLFQMMERSDKKLDAVLDDVKANKDKIHQALTWQAEFNETKTVVPVVASSWPSGYFVLLEPETGCPGKQGWLTGWMKHHTESGQSTTRDEVSLSSHFKRPVKENNGDQYYMTQHFCSKSQGQEAVEEPWPAGTYCIMKLTGNDCPAGFSNGVITWDDEDSNNNSTRSGIIPWNVEGHPKINYCCREDSATTNAIKLPSEHPFYLHRFGGTCQEVEGMSVADEFMHFYTERNQPGSSYVDNCPDTNRYLPDVRLNLCYYSSL